MKKIYALFMMLCLVLSATAMPLEGVVKRAVQNGEDVIVLTHEEDGTAHIYRVVDGEAVAELSQEGVVPVDTENPGDFLSISDIALTEDGKLVACNYTRCNFNDGVVESGYKRGTTYVYKWEDLSADPSVWFTSQYASNSNKSDQGYTMALNGSSTNCQILMSGVHRYGNGVRFTIFDVVDDEVSESFFGYQLGSGLGESELAIFDEAYDGTNFQLSVSPRNEKKDYIMDAEKMAPVEFKTAGANEEPIVLGELDSTLVGLKYNGASYVTVGEKALMVAPFCNPDGVIYSIEVLDITDGLDKAQWVASHMLDEYVTATAAATAVEVVEGGLNITLVIDNTIQTLSHEIGGTDDIEYQVYEDEITNLVCDFDNMLLTGGPSSMFQIVVSLGLGDYDRNTDTYQLLPESSVALWGQPATFIEGTAVVDGIDQTANAVVRCEFSGMYMELHLTMTSAPLEATKVVVENAVAEVEKVLLFGDIYDYALKMKGVWTNEGVDYPVLVEVPVYYPESEEPSEIFSTVTVGGEGEDDPWLGLGEGMLTITTVGDVITATGVVENRDAGVAIDITITAGTIVYTGVENATVTVKPVKMIQNGQLIIENNGVQYNAQGAQL